MKLSRRIFCFLFCFVLFFSSMTVSAHAKGDIMYGIGFTTGSNLRLRSSPSTTGKILDTAPKGDVVTVISKTGNWYKVNYNLQIGYMHTDYLRVLTKENAELGYGRINGTSVNLRSGPGTGYQAMAKGNINDKVYIIGMNQGWYKVIFGEKICYIRSDYVDLTEIPYENADSAKSPKFFRGGKSTGIAPSASALNGSSAGKVTGQQIVNSAKQYLGVPYVFGGASPSGFDCSGLVYYVLKNLGFSPYRTAEDQYKMGTYVDKSQLKPGDLVFFENTYKFGISHVGIYSGNGQFIHAPNSNSVVSYGDLNSTYWTNHYYGARRIV